MSLEKSKSVAELFLHRVAATPDGEAFLYPVGAEWKTLSWKDVGGRVRAIASGLRALGLGDEQRVAILAGTRVEWVLADIAILCAGGATTTIYPSSTPDECAYILNDSGTVFCFAESDAQAAKLVGKRADLPSLKKVIVFEGKASDDGFVIPLADLEAQGRAHDQKTPDAYEAVIRAVKNTSLATLIYTSGTTGQPKGVELTHDCWLYEGESLAALGLIKETDRQYLWLPLAHSFGKVLECAQITIGFSTAIDGRIDKLVENLAVVKPTFVAAVPRIFEKVHNKVVAGVNEAGGMKLKIFHWAFRVGREVSKLRQEGKAPSGWLAMKQGIANKLVFSKLKARFGGRLNYFVSGSAPLSRHMAEFFHAADILILEGYGLTETSAASFVNRPEKYKFGTVGLPVPGTEVKIAKEDGEILIKGRGVMRGYHNLAEATRETLDSDGWLHTGDIGELDADGFLKITDRKKDLIKTSGGKYVAPQMLEGRFKAICPFVSNVVVHGDNRNFCSALITVEDEAIKKWAKENGLEGKSYEELAGHEKVRALIQPFVDQLNAGLPSYETVKKFALLPADLTQENGELTPSLKVKRKAVEKKYKDLLDSFYTSSLVA
ncbi:MAG: long-chain fatty acid--CoA ligase [Myxococcales bacterium]|nr:long-chain fatty acid--CoA ligase [Myxococcales bacterium]